MELDMDCRASLIYSQLVSPGLDLEDVRYGQLLALAIASVCSLLLTAEFSLGTL